MFTHQLAGGAHTFISITTSNNNTATASPGHYLRVSPVKSERAAARPVRTADIRMGDLLWSMSDGTLQPAPVTGISHASLPGLYNPHTASGTIIVDSLAAFTFTDTISPSIAVHTFVTAVPRALYTCFKALGVHAVLVPFNALLLKLYHGVADAAPVPGALFAANMKAA